MTKLEQEKQALKERFSLKPEECSKEQKHQAINRFLQKINQYSDWAALKLVEVRQEDLKNIVNPKGFSYQERKFRMLDLLIGKLALKKSPYTEKEAMENYRLFKFISDLNLTNEFSISKTNPAMFYLSCYGEVQSKSDTAYKKVINLTKGFLPIEEIEFSVLTPYNALHNVMRDKARALTYACEYIRPLLVELEEVDEFDYDFLIGE